jgi:assimilatory nitrate reductase catalytic subunit
MRRHGVPEGTLVRLHTRRGQVILPASGDEGLRPGHAFVHMHWGSGFIAGDGVNALANKVFDPISRQPELKHSAAGIEAVDFPWHAHAWVSGPVSVLRARLRPWLRRLPYASLPACCKPWCMIWAWINQMRSSMTPHTASSVA